MPRMDIAMRQGATYPHIMPRGRPRWGGSRPWQGMPIDSAYGRYVRHAGKVSRTGGTGQTGHSYYGRGAVGGGNRRTWRGGRRRPGRVSKRTLCIRGVYPEKKFIDGQISTFPTATGSGAVALSIAQGPSESQRVGRTCIVTDYLFKGHIKFSATSDKFGSNRVRVVLVQDTQANKLSPVASDIWVDPDINAYRNLVNQTRYKFLFDKTYTTNAQSGGGDVGNEFASDTLVAVRANIKCCIKFEFDAASGAADTQTINSLTFFTFEEKASPGTLFAVQTRIRFVE